MQTKKKKQVLESRRNFLKGIGGLVVGFVIAYMVSKIEPIQEPSSALISFRVTAQPKKEVL